MAAQAENKYRRGLDLAVLPETAITGEAYGDALGRSVEFEGEVRKVFTRKASEQRYGYLNNSEMATDTPGSAEDAAFSRSPKILLEP